MFDGTTANTFAGSVIVETLVRLGLTQGVICPGSRSSPLTVAFARHSQIDCLVSLDERSAAFYALGLAKRTQMPVALTCTSGTAAANCFPAIIEAHYSQVPLLVLTGDRPPQLRHCRAGQTINQGRLYGDYPQWQAELALPELSISFARYLRQTLLQAWQHCVWPQYGVVHLNCPFEEPLAPLPPVGDEVSRKDQALVDIAPADFYRGFPGGGNTFSPPSVNENVADLFSALNHQRGLITVGVIPGGETPASLKAIVAIANALQFSVLCDALSSLRNTADLPLVTTYDFLLRSPQELTQLTPDVILQVGELPTSKQLRAWFTDLPVPRLVIGSPGENLDPLHGNAWFLQDSLVNLAKTIQQGCQRPDFSPHPGQASFNRHWLQAEQRSLTRIQNALATAPWSAPTVISHLPHYLPHCSTVMVANSLPVRWLEFFWRANFASHRIFVNRGANGIDGTFSTALGLAHHNPQLTVLITGDLSFLHDSNGLLNFPQLQGHLTVILLNNQGGGIFELLPISAVEDVFEPYFATPQNIDFAKLCETYGLPHRYVQSLSALKSALAEAPQVRCQVLEIAGDRRAEAEWLKSLQQGFSKP